MPTPRSEIAAAVSEGKIFVVGGINHTGSKRSFESYDPKTNHWDALAPLPCKLNHCGVAAWGSRIFVSGGFHDLRQKKWSRRLLVYDIGKDRWSELDPLPGFRHKHFMIARDGWLHLLGGLRTEEVWSYHVNTGRWDRDRITPFPEKRDHIGVLQDQNHIYVVGGRRDRAASEDCWRYDFDSRTWKTFAQLPAARGAPVVALYDGRIHVVGGEDLETKQVYRRHDILDLSTGRWTTGAPLPRGRHGMASAIIDGRWFVIGGGRLAEVGTIFSACPTIRSWDLEALPD